MGCPGVNNKASPPGRHQEQAPKQRCTFRPTTFSSKQFNSRLGALPLSLPSFTFGKTRIFLRLRSRKDLDAPVTNQIGPPLHARTHTHAYTHTNDGDFLVSFR